MKCPYCVGQETGNAIRCKLLRQRGTKWDFCIHQYFCRAEGRQKLNADAENCKIKQKGRD